MKAMGYLLILGLALTAQACAPAPAAALDAEGLAEALRTAGAEVEAGEAVEQAFFSVPGAIIRVNGQDVQVFEYADAAARQAESDVISPDGSTIGTTMVTWIDRPNFWARDRLIVLYVGTDAAIMELRTDVLAEPMTER